MYVCKKNLRLFVHSSAFGSDATFFLFSDPRQLNAKVFQERLSLLFWLPKFKFGQKSYLHIYSCKDEAADITI